MLFVQFRVNDHKYILDAKGIIEIVPYANLKQIPKAPNYVAGLLNYRGNSVPVIDVCYLMSDRPCALKLSSRIALVNHEGDNGQTICVGLLIEHLTETVVFDEGDFSESGVTIEEGPYLGRVIINDNQIIQEVNISKLIPETALNILFQDSRSG